MIIFHISCSQWPSQWLLCLWRPSSLCDSGGRSQGLPCHGAGISAVAPLGVGAAALVGQAPNLLLEVPMPLVLLVPIKALVVPRPVAAVVRAVFTATAQVVQGGVRQECCRGDDRRALGRGGRSAVDAATTPRGRLGDK